MQNALHAQTKKPLRVRNRIRLILGLMTGLAGLANMLFLILPAPNWDMLLGEWPVNTHYGTHKLLVVIGFFLVMLSYGMVRGKRHACVTTGILLLLSAILYMPAGEPVFATLLLYALVLVLIIFARYFRARSDPPTLRRGYVSLLIGLGIVTLYSIGAFLLFYDQFELVVDRFGPVEVWLHLLTNPRMLALSQGTQAFFLGRALPLLCLSAVLYGMVLLLRPVAAALLPNEQARSAAYTIARIYGTNSI